MARDVIAIIDWGGQLGWADHAVRANMRHATTLRSLGSPDLRGRIRALIFGSSVL
jgi:hypothetical protein